MPDYEAAHATFSWEEEGGVLSGLPGGRGLNIAYEAVDRHAETPGRSEGRDPLARQGRRAARDHLRAAAPAHEPLRLRARAARRRGGRLRRQPARAGPRALRDRARHAQALRGVLPALLRSSAPSRCSRGCSSASARVLVTTPALYRKKVRAARKALPALRHVVLTGAARRGVRARRGELVRRAARERERRVRDPDDLAGRRRAAPLHERHHRQAEGRDPRPRGGDRAPRDRADRARPQARRRLLVHRGSRLGDRHLVRDHLAAHPRRDERRRRGRLRRRALVRDPRARAGDGLVHGADRDPDADEGRPRAAAPASTSTRCGSSPASASRSTPRA